MKTIEEVLLLLVLAGALAGCRPPAPPAVIAPAAAADSLAIPAEVGRYHLQETEFLGETQGRLYRFTDGSRTRLSVFVYPVPPDVQGTSDPQAWVSEEAQKFPRTFPTGVERGWYDDYRLAFTNAEPLDVDGTKVPGHVVGAATRKGAEIRMELQYLYVVQGRFLKVRATVPEKGWAQTDVPTFARQLVTGLLPH